MRTIDTKYSVLSEAEGTIQAATKQQERLEEMMVRLASGEFHVSTKIPIPCKCIDGRSSANPTEGPNAAGGTETLFVADDLTSKRFASDDGSVTGGIRNIMTVLKESGMPIGGHTDDHHAHPLQSGCGANDKLEQIYAMIVKKVDSIKVITESILGEGAVDQATSDRIVVNAASRTDFPAGQDVVSVFKSSPNVLLEELQGEHNEVAAVVNLKKGTTLDRGALAHEFGNTYQAFNIDAWSFQTAAVTISRAEAEVRQKVVAMTYYNVAAALVLCGPRMPVIIVS